MGAGSRHFGIASLQPVSKTLEACFPRENGCWALRPAAFALFLAYPPKNNGYPGRTARDDP